MPRGPAHLIACHGGQTAHLNTGGFAISHAPFEVGLIAALGIAGYTLACFNFRMAPIVIGLVLGPIIEANLRNGLTANAMDLTIFITRPH